MKVTFLLLLQIFLPLNSIDAWEARIVGGTDAKQYPYFTYLNFLKLDSDKNFQGVRECGSTLIHEDIILSAAHCFVDGYTYINAFVNTTYNPFNRLVRGSEIFAHVEDWEMHADFDRSTGENDIMLLKLDRRVTSVAPVKLNADPNKPHQRDSAKVFGLGLTDPEDKGSYSDVLLETTVNIDSDNDCDSQYGLRYDSDKMLCASAPARDACHGDSGGPLVYDFGTDVQLGITSFGAGCADPNYSGVYTRVSTYHDWIQQWICDMSQNPPSSCVSHSPSQSLPGISQPLGNEKTATCKDDPLFECAMYSENSLRCYSRNPSRAKQACCACGGGKRQTDRQSNIFLRRPHNK